jgi:hypothetical protein
MSRQGATWVWAVAAVGVAGLASCQATESTHFLWQPAGPGALVATDHFAWTETPGATVLFVVDAPVGTCGLQSALWSGVPSFVDGLRSLAPDLAFHVGVVSADVSDPHRTGELRRAPADDARDACPDIAHPDCKALAGTLEPVVTASTPSAALALECLMDVGTTLTSDPFGAARAALSPERLAASGLLLPGSVLAVVVISASQTSQSACGDPMPGTSAFKCTLSPDSALDGPALLAEAAAAIPGVADVYVARLPVPVGDAGTGSDSTSGGSGPILQPDEGGLSPICSIPDPRVLTIAGTTTVSGTACTDTLGPELYGVARDLASAMVPGCLEASPCPGVGTADVEVMIESTATGTDGTGELVDLAPFEDYALVRDPSCTGGYRVDFAEDPMAGVEITIDYPAGDSVSCGL